MKAFEDGEALICEMCDGVFSKDKFFPCQNCAKLFLCNSCNEEYADTHCNKCSD